ncbi:MAG TPA: spore germination protein GerW family protein [Acidimicrobiia bacterium]|nr:spore germination protein GerW family protein [Acidimicrobiia bacterium]
MSQFEDLLADAKEVITVRKVYGDPYQSNGVTVIPAASVRGGFGSGEGEGSATTPAGRGGGMGMSGRPIGAYQIKGDQVTWIPAVDVSRVIFTGQIMAIVAMLVIRSILKRRTS